MLNCKQASRLVSESLDRRLSWRERWSMHLHLLICDMCTRFKTQMEFLQRAAREYLRRGAPMAEQTPLSAEGRERIRRAVSGNAP
jgi:hypothetical protein